MVRCGVCGSDVIEAVGSTFGGSWEGSRAVYVDALSVEGGAVALVKRRSKESGSLLVPLAVTGSPGFDPLPLRYSIHECVSP